MADLTTQLSKFLNDLMAGKLGVANAITSIVTGDGTAAAPCYAFASNPGTGISRGVAKGYLVIGGDDSGSNPQAIMAVANDGSGALGVRLVGTAVMGWAPAGTLTVGADTALVRDGAPATLALKNGTTAQTFRTYTPGLGNTHSTTGIWLYNNTAATAGTQVQMSGPLFFRGNGWNTVGLASETDDFFIENLPAAGNPSTATLKFGFSNNGGAATYPLTLTSGGLLTASGNMSAGSYQNVAAGYYTWAGRTVVTSPADGQTNLTNAAATAGFGLDNSVDSIANVRNRAQNADGGVRAAFYNSSASSVLTVTTNTIAPTGSIHHVGAGLIKTITVPALCPTTCSITIIPDAAYTYDATGNIVVPAGGGTAVVNKAMTFTWDGTKWTPSY